MLILFMSSDTSQNKLGLFLIYQTFQHLKTGVIEIVIFIFACPGYISIYSHNNQFSNGKLSLSYSPMM